MAVGRCVNDELFEKRRDVREKKRSVALGSLTI